MKAFSDHPRSQIPIRIRILDSCLYPYIKQQPMNRRNLIIIATVAVIAIFVFRKKQTTPEGVTPVKPFDLNKYLGKWYEIARFDFRFEKNLEQTTAEYSMNDDGSVKVVNRGYNYKTKEWKQATGTAKFVDSNNEGKLKVSFFGPFYSGYNVMAIDPNYRYALVAGESLDYLWILSREKSIPDDVKQNYLNLAASVGYDTTRLIWVKQ